MEKLDGQVPTHGRLTGKGIMRTTGLIEDGERRARGCTVNPATHSHCAHTRVGVRCNGQLGAEACTVDHGEHDGEDNKGFHVHGGGEDGDEATRAGVAIPKFDTHWGENSVHSRKKAQSVATR